MCHTFLHEHFPLVNIISREVIFTYKLLVAKDGGKPRPAAEQRCYAHQNDEGGIVDVEIAAQPRDQICVPCGLVWNGDRLESDCYCSSISYFMSVCVCARVILENILNVTYRKKQSQKIIMQVRQCSKSLAMYIHVHVYYV